MKASLPQQKYSFLLNYFSRKLSFKTIYEAIKQMICLGGRGRGRGGGEGERERERERENGGGWAGKIECIPIN